MIRPSDASELREIDDPEGMAIHAATQAIYDLYDLLPVETAHWLATVAIINADRAARQRNSPAACLDQGQRRYRAAHGFNITIPA